MLLFVYEYTCAALGWQHLPASLRAEGLAMLSAVLEDCQRLDHVQTCTLLADDFPHALAHWHRRSGGDEYTAFCDLAAQADYTLVIAPEFDGHLTARCGWVGHAGGRTLNSSLEALRLTSDKLALCQHWQQQGIPTPPTETLAWCDARKRWGWTGPVAFPAVCKPRCGAGSQTTHFMTDEQEMWTWAASIPAAAAANLDMIVQPFSPGQPASVAFLAGPKDYLPLLPCAQHLSKDGRFHYLGGQLPLPEPLSQRAVSLAQRAAACVPGLRGYVGVDLVLGEASDGSADVAIEINPRLTTSYIGLRQAAETNLASALLRIVQGETVELRWRAGTIHFTAEAIST